MSKIINVSNIASFYTLPDSSKKEYKAQSNKSSTENMTTSFLKEKSSEKTYGTPTEEILQTLKLTNNSEYSIIIDNIKDIISKDGTFKAGSLKVNGVSKEDEDISQGITLENPLSAGVSVTITYILVVNETPVSDVINALSEITYTVNGDLTFTEKSNTITIDIEKNDITIEKTSNKNVVVKGERLTFKNVITNNGRFTNTNVFFKDELPAETTFVAGSVKINDEIKENLDATLGFSLPDLKVNDKITVTFEVEVK